MVAAAYTLITVVLVGVIAGGISLRVCALEGMGDGPEKSMLCNSMDGINAVQLNQFKFSAPAARL